MRALPFSQSTKPGGRPRKQRAPRNAFADWLARSKIKPDVLCKQLKVTVSTVYNLRNSQFTPSLKLASLIEEVSKGAVSVKSWNTVKVVPRKAA
jgi:hypothetical protein